MMKRHPVSIAILAVAVLVLAFGSRGSAETLNKLSSTGTSPSVSDFDLDSTWIDAIGRGAVADGATDNYNALSAALAQCGASPYGGHLVLPVAGTNVYAVGTTLSVPSHCTFEGGAPAGEDAAGHNNAGPTLKWIGTGAGPVVQFYGVNHSALRNITVDCNGVSNCTGIYYDSNSSGGGNTSQYNIFDHFSVLNYHVAFAWGANQSTYAASSNQSDSTTVTHFHFRGCSASGSPCSGGGPDTTAEGFRLNSSNAGDLSTIDTGTIQNTNLFVNNINFGSQCTISHISIGSPVGTSPAFFNLQTHAGPCALYQNEDENPTTLTYSIHDSSNDAGVSEIWSGNLFSSPVLVDGQATIISLFNQTLVPQPAWTVNNVGASIDSYGPTPIWTIMSASHLSQSPYAPVVEGPFTVKQAAYPSFVVAATCPDGCTTTYSYKTACVDYAGNTTNASGNHTISNNVTLDLTHFNLITASVGLTNGTCAKIAFYGRTTGGGGEQLLGTCPGSAKCVTNLQYNDNDSTIMPMGALPTINTTSPASIGGSLSVVNGSVLASTGGTVPTVSACGTSPPVVTAGGTNNAFIFTTGTGSPTACTTTFWPGAPFANIPICEAQDTSSSPVAINPSARSTASYTWSFPVASSHVFEVICLGK